MPRCWAGLGMLRFLLLPDTMWAGVVQLDFLLMKMDDRVAVTRWWNALWAPSKALGKHPPCVAGLR